LRVLGNTNGKSGVQEQHTDVESGSRKGGKRVYKGCPYT